MNRLVHTGTLLLLGLIAFNTWAYPLVDDINGALDKDEITTAIAPQQDWFDRAGTFCKQHDFSECKVRLAVQVNPDGGVSHCGIAYTTLSDPASRSLYCQVTNTLHFPSKAQPSVFSLLFNIEPRVYDTVPGIADHYSTGHYVPSDRIAPGASKGVVSSVASSGTGPVAVCDHKATLRSDSCIRDVFDANADLLANAYQRSLKLNPHAQGAVRLTLHIASNGTVTTVETEPDSQATLSPALLQELQLIVKTLSFGPAAQDTTMPHTVNFSPN